ncbi:hypothetical protein OS31_36060 [Dickeya oryzae]
MHSRMSGMKNTRKSVKAGVHTGETLNTFFGYPPDIRKAIYTMNAIESLNSVIRQVIKKRNMFPTGDAVRKVIYLAIQSASKKWSMPFENRRLA